MTNHPEHDHPDLTAFALGELAPADAARVRKWLAQSPEARAELERIQHTVGVLQEAPALPKRVLHPRQRETVLAMAQTPEARPKNVVPFLAFRRPVGSGTAPASVTWRVVKFAAAACLVAGAFVLGQRSAERIAPYMAGNPGTEGDEAKVMDAAPAATPTAAPAPTPPRVEVAEAAVAAPQPKSAVAEPAPVAPAIPAPEPVVAAAKPESNAVVAEVKAAHGPTPAVAAPAPVPSVAAPKITAVGDRTLALGGFAPVSALADAELTVKPKFLRPRVIPVPDEFAGVVLASPQPLNAKSAPAAAPQKPEPQPALKIHNWKAEIASCPWDSSRRLMRFVVQIPVEQPGIESNERDYKLVAKFDPAQVQAFRLVTEKQMRPSGTSTLGTCFAWYEVIPARNFHATADRPATLGSIHIEQPRGASSDLTPLKLVDRGQNWSEAREDFVFETAMIGWNMLLSGTENIGGLNSKLVLDLAEKTRGEDAKGERARFINAVKQAQRAVGM
jgi:hypothetical protein